MVNFGKPLSGKEADILNKTFSRLRNKSTTMTPPKEIVQQIEEDAFEKYPKQWRATTPSERVAYFDPNQERRIGYIAGRTKQVEEDKKNAIGFAHWIERHFERTYPATDYLFCLSSYESVKLIPGILYGERYSFEELYNMYIKSQNNL